MDKSILSSHINGLKQRLIYIFDIFNERAFFIEVAGIKDEDSTKTYPICTLAEGPAPVQIFPDLPENDPVNDTYADDNISGDVKPAEE
jgi:hypothetical protein